MEEFAKELRDLPQQLKVLERGVLEAKLQMNKCKRDLESAEIGIWEEIDKVIDPATGKPLYSNDLKRKIGFFNLCQDSEVWKDAADCLRAAERDVGKKEIEAKGGWATLRSLEAISRFQESA